MEGVQLADLSQDILTLISSQLTPSETAGLATVSPLFRGVSQDALRVRAQRRGYGLPRQTAGASLYLVAMQRESSHARPCGFITGMGLERLTDAAVGLLDPEAPPAKGVGVIRAGVQLNKLSLRHGDRAANVVGLETLARLISLNDVAQHLGLAIMLIILLVSSTARTRNKDVYALRHLQPTTIRDSLATFPTLITLRNGLPLAQTEEDFAERDVDRSGHHLMWLERIGSFAARYATRSYPVQPGEWLAMMVEGQVPIIKGDLFHPLTLPYFVGAGLVCEHGAASYLPVGVLPGSYRLYQKVGGKGGVEDFQDHIRVLHAARLAGEWAIDIERVFYKLWVLSRHP